MDRHLGLNDLLISQDAEISRGAELRVNKPLTIKVKRLVPWAQVPEYETAGAAGMDVRAAWDYRLPLGERVLVQTGLAFELPVGWELQVRPRSGLALKHGVTVLNSPGTLDADYRGELGVLLVNHGTEEVWINTGDRVAQLVLAPVWKLPIEVVEELGETERGAGGFGSTGV